MVFLQAPDGTAAFLKLLFLRKDYCIPIHTHSKCIATYRICSYPCYKPFIKVCIRYTR